MSNQYTFPQVRGQCNLYFHQINCCLHKDHTVNSILGRKKKIDASYQAQYLKLHSTKDEHRQTAMINSPFMHVHYMLTKHFQKDLRVVSKCLLHHFALYNSKPLSQKLCCILQKQGHRSLGTATHRDCSHMRTLLSFLLQKLQSHTAL